MMGTWPESSSVIAAPVLLYGTFTILIFAMLMKSSVARWVMPPIPVDAYVSPPVFLPARAMSSLVDFTGSEGCTVNANGVKPNSATGTIALIGSHAGLCSAAVAEKLPDIIMIV